MSASNSDADRCKSFISFHIVYTVLCALGSSSPMSQTRGV